MTTNDFALESYPESKVPSQQPILIFNLEDRTAHLIYEKISQPLYRNELSERGVHYLESYIPRKSNLDNFPEFYETYIRPLANLFIHPEDEKSYYIKNNRRFVEIIHPIIEHGLPRY
jgi:hypothetical protein